MKKRYFILIGVIVTLCIITVPATYAGLGDFFKEAKKFIGGNEPLTESEIIKGLKEALQIGTGNAVEMVSKIDGYYKNPDIRIPLPEQIRKMEELIRAAGFGSQVDAFELSMNHAAEKAAPEAKIIFQDAIKEMSISDARKILNGRDNEATLYFQDKTSAKLHEMFKPIVSKAMSEVGVTHTYQDLNAKIKTIPFAENLSVDLDQYVTDQATNGLFFMLAEEEAKIRRDPKARVTDLLKKVFESK
ncbi:MAG: DUF4197 domain-containing protein [Deltaproteobacteria bacterium]|nr:DUF4197 domain-containing protein [Deltaproteobacteria bacterium]